MIRRKEEKKNNNNSNYGTSIHRCRRCRSLRPRPARPAPPSPQPAPPDVADRQRPAGSHRELSGGPVLRSCRRRCRRRRQCDYANGSRSMQFGLDLAGTQAAKKILRL